MTLRNASALDFGLEFTLVTRGHSPHDQPGSAIVSATNEMAKQLAQLRRDLPGKREDPRQVDTGLLPGSRR